MITYTFAEGFIATIRTSGTEPKIKYYVEKFCPPEESVEVGRQELSKFVSVFLEEMFQPASNNLQV